MIIITISLHLSKYISILPNEYHPRQNFSKSDNCSCFILQSYDIFLKYPNILRQFDPETNKKNPDSYIIHYNSCRDYCVLGLPLCHQACLQCFLSIKNRTAIPADMRQGIHAAYLPVVISARKLSRLPPWRGSNLCLPTWRHSAWRCSGCCAPAGLSRSPVLSWHRRGPSSPCRSDR